MIARLIPTGKEIDVYYVKSEFYEGRWHSLYREYGSRSNLLIEGERLVFERCPDNAELAEVRRQRDEYYDELIRLRQERVEWIDKACEWLNLHTNWGDIYADGEVEMLFRKAMEEQQ